MNREIADLEQKTRNNSSIVTFVFIPIITLISTELSINLLIFPKIENLGTSYTKKVIGYILLGFFSIILLANIVILIKQFVSLKKLNKQLTNQKFEKETKINKKLYLIITILTGIISGQNIISKNYVKFAILFVISVGGIVFYNNILNIFTIIVIIISTVDLLIGFTKKSKDGKIILLTKGVKYE